MTGKQTIDTYNPLRNNAISVRMSESGRDVSSNPGVSIRMTLWPSTSKGDEWPISEVQLRRPCPTLRSDPQTVLINCRTEVSFMLNYGTNKAYTSFPGTSWTHNSTFLNSNQSKLSLIMINHLQNEVCFVFYFFWLTSRINVLRRIVHLSSHRQKSMLNSLSVLGKMFNTML